MVTAAGFQLAPPRPRHIGAAVGTAVHAGIAYTLQTKRTSGTLGNETEAENRAEMALIEQTQNGVTWDETSANIPIAKQQAARMVRTYRRHLAPTVTPLIVEERLVADVGDGWLVSGQADLLTGNPDEGLRDNKTGTVRRANGVQYGAYAIVFEAHGYRVPELHEDFIRRVSIKSEQPPPLTVEVDRGEAVRGAWNVISAIKRSASEFEARLADPHGDDPLGAFLPNPASSLCGERWCPAWGTKFCRAHA